MRKLSGVFCAFWTATDASGELIEPAIERHLKFLVTAGINGFMALGSTAEFPHLNVTRRKRVLEKIAETKLPVIANVSHVSHRAAIDLARHAKTAGAAAIALLPPWFFAMAQRDMAEFFITVARASDLPLVLYNFPEMTGKKIELETIRRVAEEVPVLGVKQSGSEFPYHHELLRLGKELSYSVLTGADTRWEEALRLGCAGTISGVANAVPEVLKRTFDNFQKGADSSKESAFLAELGSKLGNLEFPLNIKALIAARGFETGAVKNPISAETLRRYGHLVEEFTAMLARNP